MARVKAEIELKTASGTHEVGEEFDFPTNTPEQQRDLDSLLNGGALSLAGPKRSTESAPRNTQKTSGRKDPAEELKEG